MRLVTVAHGTRHATGNRVAATLTRAAGERLGAPAEVSYVELCPPLVGEVLGGGSDGSDGSDPWGSEPTVPTVPRAPTVLVPLLLTTGYHLRVDLPAAVAAAPGRVELTAPLGPDPLLAAAQVDRLLAAGAVPGQPVVLVAAGSRDPAALPDLECATDLLGGAWGGAARLATLGGAGPRLHDVVQPGDAVSPYLLADGFFATRCSDLARAGGASVVADVIGPHERVVELVVGRFTTAAGRVLV